MQKVEERLADIYGGGRWIAVNTVAASMSRTVDALQAWGSEVMVVAASEGFGDLPDVPIAYTGTSGESFLDSVRRLFAALVDPEDELLSAVDDFDSDQSARVILPPFASDRTILRRDAYGVRPRRWTALEDKIAVLKIWEEAGIAVAPSRVVSVSQAAGAAHELASHLGTVWVADNSQGWHGGGEYVRWVPGPEDYEEAAAWFEGRARKVRVMPFLDGLPCSIHGWVDDSTTGVFRPVEILVLRTPEPGFKYAGVSTRWDPPPDLREEMRSAAGSVGEVLRESVGYRGPFGIDGIATTDGFLPTEFNARLTAAALTLHVRLAQGVALASLALILPRAIALSGRAPSWPPVMRMLSLDRPSDYP